MRKSIQDASHILEEAGSLLIEGNLNEELKYEELPIRIFDTKEQVQRWRTILYVKVQWSNHSDWESTWELEEKIREQYCYFFEDQTNPSFEDKKFPEGGGIDHKNLSSSLIYERQDFQRLNWWMVRYASNEKKCERLDLHQFDLYRREDTRTVRLAASWLVPKRYLTARLV